MTQMLKDTEAKDAKVREEIKNKEELKTKQFEAEKAFLLRGPGFQPGLVYSQMQYLPTWAEIQEGGNVI